MSTLRALDFDLSVELGDAVRRCVDERVAFCVLDRRLSTRARAEELANLGATELCDASGTLTLANGRAVDDEIGLVMLTSGSSARPKAAEVSWRALEASAQMTNAALRSGRVSVWFPVLPACHIGGLAVILRTIFTDARVVWGPPETVALAPSRGATHVSVVRAQLTRHDLSGFDCVLLGGATPPTTLGNNVTTTWGMTETGSGIVYNGVALAGVDVSSVNGELIVRSPTLFRSYRDAPRPQRRGPDLRDDWFPTGDGGEIVNGTVRVFGRLGSLINTGGEKLFPETLEAALSTLPGVREVAIVGVDDPEWGQRVVALVVGDGNTFDDEIRERAAEHIGPWAKPKEIRYVNALPKTTNGKIRRGDLEHLY